MNKFIILAALFVIMNACNKDKIYWNLPRDNNYDSKQHILGNSFEVLDCESSNKFEFFNNGKAGGWFVTDCFTGKGFKSDMSISGASISLNIMVDSSFIFNFMTKKYHVYEGKNSDVIPEIFINGLQINGSKIQTKNNGWCRIQTASIDKGLKNIEIKYPPDNSKTFSYFNYYLDEIRFYYD